MKVLLLIGILFGGILPSHASENEQEAYRAGLKHALASGNADSLAVTYCRLGEYYAYRDADSARYYCRKGLKYADRSASEPYLTLLNDLANSYISTGELKEGIRLMRLAYDEAGRLDYGAGYRASALTSIGVAYRLREMPDSALHYYNQALDMLQGREMYDEETHLLTSIAVLYANTSRLEEAEQYVDRALQAADRCNDIDMMFYAYTTAGSIYVLQGKNEKAVRLIHPVLDKARLQQKPRMVLKCLTFMIAMFHRTGQRDSVDYYIPRAEELVPVIPAGSTEVAGYRETLYMILSSMGRYRESLRIQQELLSGTDMNQLGPVNRLYLYMARNYHALHESDEAARYYELAYEASDSLHAADVEAQLSELTVRYETQEKELEIARLAGQQSAQRARLMQWITVAALLFFLLLAFTGWFFYRRRRIRKEQELNMARSYIDGLESERARLAKDLHDGVCNDLLGIGMQMQGLPPTAGREHLLELVEQVRGEVRGISHELMPPQFRYTTLDEMISDYLERSSGKTCIHFHKSYEAGSDWRDIPEEVAYEVYRILQELFSNIVRHAEATRTDIELRLTPSVLSLLINDDDTTSFASSSGTPGHGIGLNTVRERVKALKGTLRISTSESGQSFLLEVPLCGENKGKKG